MWDGVGELLMEKGQAGNTGPQPHTRACQVWHRGVSAPVSSAGAVGISLGRASILPPTTQLCSSA